MADKELTVGGVSIQRIGNGAFQDCESLKQPLFPPTVEIGKNAFKGTR